MSLDGADLVWVFDGRNERDSGLSAMVAFYVAQLRDLLPSGGDSEDPFTQIVADLSDDPTDRMLANPHLSRLFPPALAEAEQAAEFWRDSIHDQTRARIADAEVVRADLSAFEGFVPVRFDHVDAWAKTLGALRLFWYSGLAGAERLAEPVVATIEANPGPADLVDWLGYVLDDLMESRATCLEDASLDPGQFMDTEW